MNPFRLNQLTAMGAAILLAACAAPPAPPSAPPPPAPKPGGGAVAPRPMAAPARPVANAPVAPSQVNVLETILKRVGNDKDVEITRTATGALLLRATGDTAFATGSSALTPSFSEFLKQLANGLQTYGNLSMKVTGHTDNTGDSQLNDKLSEARASAAINYLVAQGVPASRMLGEGKGQADPIASNDSAAGRASNRRVDMLIIELAKP